MTYATPRSVRANCLSTMKGIIQRRKKISKDALKAYIMREYNITAQTFERYISDLKEMKLIAENSGMLVWNETQIDFGEESELK